MPFNLYKYCLPVGIKFHFYDENVLHLQLLKGTGAYNVNLCITGTDVLENS